MPSITFNLLTAEVFPWAILYSLTQKINLKRGLPFFFLLFCSILYTIFYTSIYDVQSDIFRSFLAYLNPILVFLAIYKCSGDELDKLNTLLKTLTVFFVVLGVLQFSGIVGFLSPIFKLLLTRGSTETFGLGRGVSLLSSEPSRAAYEIIFIYMAWIYVAKFAKRKELILDFLFLFFITLILRSSLGIFTFMVYLLAKYKWKLLIPILCVSMFMVPFLVNSSSRAVQIIYQIFKTSSTMDLYVLFLQQSGFRLISMIGAYQYGFLHPFGGGVGLWKLSSLEALELTGVKASTIPYFVENSNGYFTAVRPDSFMASVSLDFGLFGILCILYMLKPLISLLRNTKSNIFPIFITFFFILFFSGAVGNPIPWICVAIVYRNYTIKELNV